MAHGDCRTGGEGCPLHMEDWLASLDDKMDTLIKDSAANAQALKSLLGNGQPGRVQKLEDRLDRVSARVWIILGIGIVLGFIGLEGMAKILR